MRYKAFLLFLIFSCLYPLILFASTESIIEHFSPQGLVKNVRQVSVTFSEQMVSFGDPVLLEPFDIKCSEKGHGRWLDTKHWVYDFDRNLPGGTSCEFILKKSLMTLSGKPIKSEKVFSFNTGGPSIIEIHPYEGSEYINEDQIFLLSLDAEPDEESVLQNAFFSVEGITEKIGVRIIKGKEKEDILKTRYRRQDEQMFQLLIQAKQIFPSNVKVQLIWGRDIESLSGVKNIQDQIMHFKSRGPFTASFNCERENPESDCIPLLPMYLSFSSPVPHRFIDKIILKSSDGKIYKPSEKDNIRQDDFFYSLTFPGPFPEKTSFLIEIKDTIEDDSGRKLSNIESFPLFVKTDYYPALAKFSARFGIIETIDPVLPVTVRNIEPQLKTRMLRINDNSNLIQEIKGNIKNISFDKEEEIIEWMKRLASAKREKSIFNIEKPLRVEEQLNIQELKITKLDGSKSFEVVGIPLKSTGFYIIEIESKILGNSLLSEQKPFYVPAGALVTNLSAHFKWGRESSLVWVTTLNDAVPVSDADVHIRDCQGKVIWKGKTNADGIAMINKELHDYNELPTCPLEINYRDAEQTITSINTGLFIFARKDNDLTFVHSSWDNGIEPWRFNLPEPSYQGPVIAHTIFDRTLLRAGDTVHMKHIIRKHTTQGFSFLNNQELPKSVMIQHIGSSQRFEFPLKWDENGVASTDWQIPVQSKLGNYEVILLKKALEKPSSRTNIGGYESGDEEYFIPDGWHSGAFRVEEFKVPLMKAVLQPPTEPLINVSEANIDIILSYISGGGAGNTPVKLRTVIQPKQIFFNDYNDYLFSNGGIKQGIKTRASFEESEERLSDSKYFIKTQDILLDKTGNSRAKITDIPKISQPRDLHVELEFRDPNGEIQTASTRIPLWNSKFLIGIKPDSWALSKDSFKFSIVVLNLDGKEISKAPVKVELFQKLYYSHRKRLVGGYYAYEHVTEIKRLSDICEGQTDSNGLLLCEAESPVSGNVIIQAKTHDEYGNEATAYHEIWVSGKDDWWFDVSDNDRIDLLPENRRYEPGDTARLQARMPFREATALVTVEREGIIDVFIKKLSGKSPIIEIPVKGNYAPNVFISALIVRGRVSEPQPTAMVDLAKPAYKLGISEIKVGWRAHELKVSVEPERSVYKIREKAKILIKVKPAEEAFIKTSLNNKLKYKVAVAAVDEGLLELMPNHSWKLLKSMMNERGYEIHTATAQMQIVGKRHYGLKALPQGGGGGKQTIRELFNTLLYWNPDITLNRNGEATIEIPLNDSLTGFRIAAIAFAGDNFFGEGEANIRTTQDLIIISSIPASVREGDFFRANFTIRNASDRNMKLKINGQIKTDIKIQSFQEIYETLSAGEAKEIGWDVSVQSNIDKIEYEIKATELSDTLNKTTSAYDTLKVIQKVLESVPERVFQSTMTQVEKTYSLDIKKPDKALNNKGRISLYLNPHLSNGLAGVQWFMKHYPYACMEQKISKAIALKDIRLWENVISELPAHLDANGLVKYFPPCNTGSDVLTSYILSISKEAGFEIPSDIKNRMQKGLTDFIEGRIIRWSSLPTADVSIRKLAAIEALSRWGYAKPSMLNTITIEPNLWPTSSVIDWINILSRIKSIPEREKKIEKALQILRARINFSGTTFGFSTEKNDYQWWLMTSPDTNAVKTVLTLLEFNLWNDDIPKITKGTLSRQVRGFWNTTVSNAWGVLAMEKFSSKYEKEKITGITSAQTAGEYISLNWSENPNGGILDFNWRTDKDILKILHEGAGKPWATIQSIVAIPQETPIFNGFKIKKNIIPLEQKNKGFWSRGDVIRIKLEIDAQTDMTWVVVNDPVPAGSSILKTGLARDSKILTESETKFNWVSPIFIERSFDSFKAYYEFIPKGKWTVEYTIRLNNQGIFNLPSTRVEALYAPEIFGGLPNENIEIR